MWSPRATAWATSSSSQSTWCCSTATPIAPLRSNSKSMPNSASAASIASRFSMPSRSSVGYLVGPSRHAVLAPVREARLAEPAVAAGGRPSDRFRLHEDHVGVGIAALREHCRPEARIAATDDREPGDWIFRQPLTRALRRVGPGGRARTRGWLARREQCSMTDAGGRRRSNTVVPKAITPRRSVPPSSRAGTLRAPPPGVAASTHRTGVAGQAKPNIGGNANRMIAAQPR